MNTTVKTGDSVAWQWGNGLAEGTIKSVHSESTMTASKGRTIKRNGSDDSQALIISHTSGNDVLKLASEVQKTN